MAMVFRFRALTDENDNFIRDYEVMYDTDLLGFHDFICDDLGYDKSSMASFFLSDGQWDKLQEYTLFDMNDGSEGAPLPMEGVGLGQVIRNSKDRLIFVFDVFGDRALYIELTASLKAEEGAVYPRVTMSQAEAPDQFDAGAVSDEGSIFDDALGDFGNFEGDDFYDDEI